jgi:hypothetical protein
MIRSVNFFEVARAAIAPLAGVSLSGQIEGGHPVL